MSYRPRPGKFALCEEGEVEYRFCNFAQGAWMMGPQVFFGLGKSRKVRQPGVAIKRNPAFDLNVIVNAKSTKYHSYPLSTTGIAYHKSD